jgi:hypothetical protein
MDTPPIVIIRNAAAAASGARWRTLADRRAVRGPPPAAAIVATAVSTSTRSGTGSASTSARQEARIAATRSSAPMPPWPLETTG